jgi:DNA-binding NtrC family response regulator
MKSVPHKPTLAVVDDDPRQRELVRGALERAGYAVLEGTDGLEGVALAENHPLDGMILDVRMPGMSGLEALGRIKAARPEIVVLLLTAYIDLRDAIAAIKTGAHDYLEKPIDLDELVVAVDEALGVGREQLPSATGDELELPGWLIAESAAMRGVLREAAQVAPTDASVLILGESGTGKEVLTRFIHERSARAGGPLVAVNCAALPENLIESELFGHERGAFTGAVGARAGRFEEAHGGTLLLDEIGEMPLALQPKLLRVLEERRIRRVGGNREIGVDVRVVAATNRPLEEDAHAGRFREDLLYRLNVITLRLPPLRERRDDIAALAERFLADQGMAGKRFSPAAMRRLLDHRWPGNVRELRNAVVRAGIVAGGALILPEDLPESVRTATPSIAADAEGSGGGVLVGDMEAIQKQAILEALEKTGGNKSHAAKLLGISRRNLIYKLRSWGM